GAKSATLMENCQKGKYLFTDLSSLAEFISGIKLEDRAAIDVENGLILFPRGEAVKKVLVTYSYAFSGNYGGGAYVRKEIKTLPEDNFWTATVSQSAPPRNHSGKKRHFKSLTAAIRAWSKSGCNGNILIQDNRSYSLPKDGLSITVPGSRRLVVQSKAGAAPCIIGDMKINGGSTGSTLVLGGLWIRGQLNVEGAMSLQVTDCTIQALHSSGRASKRRSALIFSGGPFSSLSIDIKRSITGPIKITGNIVTCYITDCIVDGYGGLAMRIRRQDKTVNVHNVCFFQTTFLGQVDLVRLIEATNVIFSKRVIVEDRDSGYVRFSSVAAGSETPIRYRCVTSVLSGEDSKNKGDARLEFTSQVYGQPGYAQLGLNTSKVISDGGENGSEIGAFNLLMNTVRYKCLKNAVESYVPFGLTTDIVIKT
ncbi:MAG: hypothetical protein AAFP70_20405, partial [Calditrichota bacterium]